MWFWKPTCRSEADNEITKSIKALKTLSIVDGRVSIAPSEVLGSSGYHEARARAADLVRKHQCSSIENSATWSALDDVGLEALSKKIAHSLTRSRRLGLSLDDAFFELRNIQRRDSA